MPEARPLLMETLLVLALLATVGACSDHVSWDDGAGGSAGAGGLGGGAAGIAGAANSVAGASSLGGGAGGAGAGAGGGAGTSPGAAGSSASPYANLAAVREIVTFKCGGAGCHSGEHPPTMIDDAALYATLTTFVAQRCGGRVLVKPGFPLDSAFYLAQLGQCADSAEPLPRMPAGCVDNCTPAEYLEGVRQWIASGAPQQ